MELTTDPAKVLKAYQIINQQLVHEVQKKRIEIRMHEERYNGANEMLLRERQENKALREMVRKLKDQIQVITKVIVSVQEQTDNVFERINRPHELAERMMQNYTPRAQQIYERRRTENPPYVDEFAIAEEPETSIVMEHDDVNEDMAISQTNNDTRANESRSAGDETFASNRSSDTRPNHGVPLPTGSPLVQRLKRPSKNTSFDESFETIDRERAFKLSRHSQGRRKIYVNIEENIADLQSVYNSSQMDIDEQLSETLRNLSPVKMDDDGANTSAASSVEKQLSETLHNLSTVKMDDDGANTSAASSVESTKNEMRLSVPSPKPDNTPGHHSQLKKTVSESMLSQIHRTNEDGSEGSYDATRQEHEMTAFNPADLVASCSTPVTKGTVDERATDAEKDSERPRRGRGRGRGRGRPLKARSETELHTFGKNPVVVLRPLTETNIRAHERKMQPTRKARIVRSVKYQDTSGASDEGSMRDGGVDRWEPSSSVENLSTLSNESNRPRRRVAPKSLREPQLNVKLRRN
uniref:Shugoshin C-terminal domain-containing protein n=1 Tax=Anopheles minimus TaxID=112268 RepID=A0A182WLS5_9DIPT